MGELTHDHGVGYHQYADYTQLYISARGKLSEVVNILVSRACEGLNRAR